jgi:hypothetical protein
MVQQIGGNLSDGRLSGHYARTEGAAAEGTMEVARIVWGELLFVYWFENCHGLAGFTS